MNYDIFIIYKSLYMKFFCKALFFCLCNAPIYGLGKFYPKVVLISVGFKNMTCLLWPLENALFAAPCMDGQVWHWLENTNQSHLDGTADDSQVIIPQNVCLTGQTDTSRFPEVFRWAVLRIQIMPHSHADSSDAPDVLPQGEEIYLDFTWNFLLI